MAEEREAHYFHWTLYSFSGKAVEAVIGVFRKAVDNVAVKCHYDRELDGFELTCPQHIGPEANDTLQEAICQYVDGELEAAAREERDAIIERFPESVVDDFDNVSSNDSSFGDREEEAAEERVPRDAYPVHIEVKGGFLHSVSDDCGGSTLKLFNLRDTVSGMLERTLAHPGHRAQEAVYRGLTCRAARWGPEQGYYVFNGRCGSPVERAGESLTVDNMLSCSFVPLYGQLRHTGAEILSSHGGGAPMVQHWNFTGEIPTVDQYLDGMGTTELVDPETARDPSEVPSDALKYNAAPDHQTRFYGRSRRPAAVEPQFDENYDLSGDEDKDDSDDDFNSSSTDDESSEKAQVLNRFRNTAITQPMQGEHIPTASASQHTLPISASMVNDTGLGSVAGASHLEPQNLTISAHTTTMPNYQRSYARVDRNGLTGNAGMQAQWEQANPIPSLWKLNRHGITRRAPTQIRELSPQPTSNSSTAMSLSTGPEFQEGQSTPTPASSFSIAPPLTMLEDSFDIEPEQQPWATRTQSAAVKTGDLIDVSLPSLPRSRENTGHNHPPPGLEQSHEGSFASSSRHFAVTAKPLIANKEENVREDLVDLTWEESARTKPSTKISWNDKPLKPTVRLPSIGNSPSHQGDDCIVERLQDTTSRAQPVRFTMRQKAGKKNEANKASTTSKPRVQLPKPSPPPPPRSSVVKGKAKEAAASGQAQRLTRNGCNNEKPKESHIEKLLCQVEHLHGRQDVELQVSFGMILVRPQDDGLCTGNWISSALQRRLQAEEDAGGLRTDFFERLTTSATDAAFMIDLLPGDYVHPRVVYEITVRLLQGETRVIKFDQKKPCSFAVFYPEWLAATLYMHYPVRVHDGRSRVIKTEPALDVDSTKVASFVSSFHSVDEAPSFMASVPTQSLSVERVHVKRIFAKQIVPGVQLEIEEILDLKLDSVANDKNFNLKATAASRPFMIDNHRLWFECSLYLAPFGGVQGSVLQSLVDQMVAEIDGVGYHNKGPYYKTEIEEKPEAEVRFW